MDDTPELVARAQRGDLRAANDLLSRHQSLAYTSALRLLADPGEAEEVAQEALLRAYARLCELREPQFFAAWLRRMTANLAVTRLRRRGRIRFESLEQQIVDDDGTERARDVRDESTPSPEDVVIDMLDAATIQALLQRLPTDQRVAVVLRDFYGYDMSEVAELTRCGLSAAKMRVSRGRAALRVLIESRGSER